jgi:hypothetical protein
MLNFCGIVAAILKMETGRNVFDVGNQFRTLKSNNVEFVRYFGGHFENGDR